MIKHTKYTKEYKDWLVENAPKYTMKQLVDKSIKKFGYTDINRKKIRSILQKITDKRWKDYDVSKVASRNFSTKPIGYESTRDDGMTKIKVGDKKWIYKQRYIYEQNYGKIPDDYMIVFLNGDRTDYRIENLMAVSTKEYNYIKNKKLISDDEEITRTAILSARVNYKVKEIK